ncbi:MAG: VWA domain-containing protein [Minisyncoccia bacterium]
MKKILLSTAIVMFVGGALAMGGTGAFFSDRELSGGNIFTAGAIDLKIDNESYYNGKVSTTTSWTLSDLTIEKFFNFLDLKPDDYGEDTVSIHVDTNDAYLCANITLTSDDDNGINEPESASDQTDGPGAGELGDNVNFMWWADDGDNVLEDGENVISQGPIGDLTLNVPYYFTLADSDQNIWTGSGGPVPGEKTLYIGKAWCFGSISPSPLSQSSTGSRSTTTPAGDGNNNLVLGEPEDGGYLCDGTGLNNSTQTDSLTADVSFSAIQSRNNRDFQCQGPSEPEVTSLTLIKQVIGIPDVGPNESASSWTLSASGGPTPFSGPGPSVNSPVNFQPGAYTLSENVVPGYTSGNWNCDAGVLVGDELTLAEGQSATCTIINTEEAIACNARIDLMIVMDNSSSINDTEEAMMKSGAVAFVNALTITTPGNHGGLTSFDDGAVLSQALTDNQATLLAAVNAPFGSGLTNLEAGILGATTELGGPNDRTPDTDSDFPDVMVVITDGNPTASNGPDTDEIDAFNAATAAKSAGIEVYVVGVGADVNAGYLATIASPGKYYSAENFSDLESALLTIANCGQVPTGTLTVTKVVVSGNDPTPASIGDFPLFVDGLSVVSGVSTTTIAGSHVVSETNNDPDYTSVIGGPDCDANGNVTVPIGGVASCTITNTWNEPHGTLTVNKVRVGGFGLQATSTFQFVVNGGAPTNFESDGSNQISVPVGPYTVAEVATTSYSILYSAGCSGVMSPGGNETCTITNTAEIVNFALANGNFGTGATTTDINSWDEEGTDSDATTQSIPAGSGQNIGSPDGDKFAIIGNDEWICKAVSTSGFSSLSVSYYWKGDPDAEDGESGVLEHRSNGTCNSGGGWTTVATHELDDANNNLDEGWSSLQGVGLPNDITLFRFRNGSNSSGEDFRVDGVSLTGIPN